jgi:hypothetical protein
MEKRESDYQEEDSGNRPESRFTKLRIMEKYAVRLRKGEEWGYNDCGGGAQKLGSMHA